MSKLIKTAALTALIALSSTKVSAQDSAFKLPVMAISEELTIDRHEIAVLGSTMSYLEEGEGDVVVFSA